MFISATSKPQYHTFTPFRKMYVPLKLKEITPTLFWRAYIQVEQNVHAATVHETLRSAESSSD